MADVNGRLTALENVITDVGTKPPAYVAGATWEALREKTDDLPPGRYKGYVGCSPDDWDDNPGAEDQDGAN